MDSPTVTTMGAGGGAVPVDGADRCALRGRCTDGDRGGDRNDPLTLALPLMELLRPERGGSGRPS